MAYHDAKAVEFLAKDRYANIQHDVNRLRGVAQDQARVQGWWLSGVLTLSTLAPHYWAVGSTGRTGSPRRTASPDEQTAAGG
jgi:hypothetical protein